MFGGAPFGGAPFGSEAKASGNSASFSISPNAVFPNEGALTFTATGFLTTWGVSNPFSIVSGPGTDLTNYVNVSATEATFDLTVGLSGSIVIADSDSGTNSAILVAVASDYWSDSMTRENAVNLGTQWEDWTNGFDIVSNKAVPDNSGLAVSVYKPLNDSVAPWPDYTVFFKSNKPTPAGAYIGLIGRAFRRAAGDCYYLGLPRTATGTDTHEIYRVVDNIASSLGTAVALEHTNGNELGLRMINNTVALVDTSGTVLAGPFTDTDPVGTLFNVCGHAGFRSNNGTTGAAWDFRVRPEGVSVVTHTSGSVTPTTARLNCTLSAPRKAKVRYSTDPAMASPTTTSAVNSRTTAPYDVVVDISGLSDGAQYYYEWLVNDVAKQAAPYAKFKTATAAVGTVKFAFVTCAWMFDLLADGTAAPYSIDANVFARVLEWGPDAAGWFGDLGYTDSRPGGGSTTVAHFLERYRHVNSFWTRTMSSRNLMRAVPMYVTWDNHEVPQSFHTSFLDSVFEVGAQPFREYYAGNPDPYRAGTDYYVINLGRGVELFVTDTLQNSSPYTATDDASKYKIDAQQEADWQEWISTSTATFKGTVSATSVDPWAQSFSTTRAWGTSFKTQLHRMWDYIKNNDISGTFWLTGDNHYHAAYKTTWNGKQHYSFCSSPSNHANISPPAGAGSDADTIFINSTLNQGFGRLTFRTDIAPATLIFEIANSSGIVVNSVSLTVDDLDAGNTPSSGANAARAMHYYRMRRAA